MVNFSLVYFTTIVNNFKITKIIIKKIAEPSNFHFHFPKLHYLIKNLQDLNLYSYLCLANYLTADHAEN